MKEKTERVAESVAVLKRLYELGVPRSLPVCEKLRSLLSEYVETGQSKSGKMDFPEVDRKLVYKLHDDRPIEVLLRR
jgi:hypothetical protein